MNTTEIKFFVNVESFETTMEHGGRGTFFFPEYFDTLEKAENFLEDMKDDEKFQKYVRDNDGYPEIIHPEIYKQTVIVEKIK